jgi:hypothetical protein
LNSLNNPEVIQSVSQKHYDRDYFSEEILENEALRDEFVRLMCWHPHIMVYDHCFYIIEKACQEKPELFYKYFSDFRALLDHPNSYHRDFGLILIATLAQVDQENRVEGILDAFLIHACDLKFMTALCCVRNCGKIIQAKPELLPQVWESLFASEKSCTFSPGQKALMRFDMLNIIEFTVLKSPPQEHFQQYILDSLTSESPKTRKKAKELAARCNLHLK